MPTFVARSPMPVDRAALFAYHARPGALERLVPPWAGVQIIDRGGGIREGDRVTLQTRLGPLRQRWLVEHFDYIEAEQFRDRQIAGPFKTWTHTHRMLDGPTPGTSVLEDRIDYELPGGVVGRSLGGGVVARELQRGFDFRHTRTRHDLVRQAADPSAPRMTIAISGASGAIAANLVPFLTTAGHAVRRLMRGSAAGSRPGDLTWTPQTGEVDREALSSCDAIIHLAGQSIAERWTPERKRQIYDSRVLATRKLCETLAAMPRRPRVLVAASAVGYYGDRGDEPLDETSPAGNAWTSEMCTEWEAATQPARDAGMRVVNVRIGVVISANSGAVAKMLTPTKLGLAGRMGNGRQYVPWVAMDDIVGILHACLMRPDWDGPINGVTGSVPQAEFVHTLGRVLRRPTIVPMPAVVVRALFGEMGQELLLASANVQPARLRELRFDWALPTLEAALRFELGR